MSEKEIRGILQELCDDLDRRFRGKIRKVVLPAALGAGMALGGCGDSLTDVVPLYAAPGDDMSMTELGPQPDYMAPDPDLSIPADMGVDFQPIGEMGILYAGPSPDLGVDSGPQPEYMAPDDMGAMPPYMAPDPDVGPPQPDYMAPDGDGGFAPPSKDA